MTDTRTPLYVGKALHLRNRLQQHQLWEWLEEKREPLDEDSIVFLRLCVWYIESRDESMLAEVALIRALKPVWNRRCDGDGRGWALRLPDIDGFDPLRIRPESRKDVGGSCRVGNGSGVYCWYLEPEREFFDWARGLLGTTTQVSDLAHLPVCGSAG